MTDYSGLVERLRDYGIGADDMREAASAIEAQRRRIERLEGALVIAERHLALIAETGRATVACKDAAKFARAALEAKS